MMALGGGTAITAVVGLAAGANAWRTVFGVTALICFVLIVLLPANVMIDPTGRSRIRDMLTAPQVRFIPLIAVPEGAAYPQLDTAHPGIPIPQPVAVAAFHPFLGAFAVARTARGVCFGVHQRLREPLDQRPQQIRTCRARPLLRRSAVAGRQPVRAP